jgi:hypothetical protein
MDDAILVGAFLSAITGAIPLPDFMSNENLGRIMAASKEGIPVLAIDDGAAAPEHDGCLSRSCRQRLA